jgi:hypothetical protein
VQSVLQDFMFVKFIVNYKPKGKRDWEEGERGGNRPEGLQADNDNGFNMYKNYSIDQAG